MTIYMLSKYSVKLMRRGLEDVALKAMDTQGNHTEFDFIVEDEGDMHRRLKDVYQGTDQQDTPKRTRHTCQQYCECGSDMFAL